MLVLNRRPGEAIVVAGGIRIIVISCDRRGVRVGIEAPSDIAIHREELVNAVAAANRQARARDTGLDWTDRLPVTGEPR